MDKPRTLFQVFNISKVSQRRFEKVTKRSGALNIYIYCFLLKIDKMSRQLFAF